MLNPTWLHVGAVYAIAVALARRGGVDLPKRIAFFFYALVVVFMFRPLTQDYVNLPVDFLKTLPPWAYLTHDHVAINNQTNDLALQIVPWAHQVREAWKSFHPPLWNSFSAAGYPLLASGQSSALSPLRILGLPLSLAHAMTFEAAMKILIALTFMFLWCRRRGHSELASAAGALAFGFSTFVVVWLHFPIITTACFVPAVFYLIDLLAERVTYARFVAFAAVWAVMLFGGHPETASHTGFLAGLYVIWIVAMERKASWRFLATLAAALVVAALLAAPFLATFAEAVTKSKRYMDLEAMKETAVPFSDRPSAMLLIAPQFFGAMPHESWGPAHAESISGFAGILGIAGWFAMLAHVIARRAWRSRDTFFVLAAPFVVGVILEWPVISTIFKVVFRLAANARLRLMLALLLAMLTASLIDLATRNRRAFLAGLFGASGLLLIALMTTDFANAYRHDTAVIAIIPSMLVVLIALTRVNVLIVVALVAELWTAGRDWNPNIPMQWMYPKTPLIAKLDALAANVHEPFRIVGSGATMFPNVSAVYGYEDVRAHDPMVSGRTIRLYTQLLGYDATNYFASWPDFERRFNDFMNIRFVITTWRGTLPERYHLRYDGRDGRIFENVDVLPRFYAVRNVILEFNDAMFARRLRELEGYAHTALIEHLELESEEQRADFFAPRPANAPVATTEILSATPTDYRLHVKAPRYTLVVSSIAWWPGWKVERNGARVEPIRVNGGFLGFVAPPGELDVHVWYDPWTFRLGAIVSGLTLAALIGISLRKRV